MLSIVWRMNIRVGPLVKLLRSLWPMTVKVLSLINLLYSYLTQLLNTFSIRVWAINLKVVPLLN